MVLIGSNTTLHVSYSILQFLGITVQRTSVKALIAFITVLDRLLRGDTLKDDFPLASDISRMAWGYKNIQVNDKQIYPSKNDGYLVRTHGPQEANMAVA